jgi:hypothetical protein
LNYFLSSSLTLPFKYTTVNGGLVFATTTIELLISPICCFLGIKITSISVNSFLFTIESEIIAPVQPQLVPISDIFKGKSETFLILKTCLTVSFNVIFPKLNYFSVSNTAKSDKFFLQLTKVFRSIIIVSILIRIIFYFFNNGVKVVIKLK